MCVYFGHAVPLPWFIVIEHACSMSCLVKSLESSDVALWRAGSQVMWQVGSRGQGGSKGGWSCEVYGGHCCMGENVWK